MSQTNISIRVEENLKKQFDSLCEELGLSMSTAINIFLKRFIREGGLPFALSIDDYNEETRKVLKDYENGNLELIGPFDNTKDLMESLLEDNE